MRASFIFLAIFCLAVLLVFIFFLTSLRKENVLLKTAIQQYEHQIQEKEKELQELKQQMDYLVSQQKILEKSLKVRKENIKKISLVVSNMTEKEICDEFKRLGYTPICR